ncbi:hypothetical protein [Mycolicibacterium sp. F2034L]|uniref:hypothetical protein n=1 Tax=Mycolicibacterium sp. F2034L TaxID=2926422 RepID=UPI001FF4F2D5|nr:hypothetical protein [Mycolicibacterium sp. F2034L]MCK0177202.1 hypothetical protein [Mycolicibacterium sp. F2034L]
MPPVYALALSLLVTAPLLAPGYLLLRDAVSTPRSYLSDAALGLSEAAPRALPQDFAVAMASQVLDGGIVVKALLVAGLWLAGWGAARLAATVLPDAGVPGRCVAVTVAIWNPYVAERLLQGHWSLLVGYGALPWVAATVLRLRDGSGGWWPLPFWIALAGLTPTGALLATAVALVGVCAPGAGRRRWQVVAATLAALLVTAAPWLVAAAVSKSLAATVSGSMASGVAVFAARAEPGLGTLGSLAGLGGIWNAEAVPDSRTGLFAVVATLALLAVVAVGATVAVRRPAAVPLLVLAVAAVVFPALMATGPGLAAVEAIVRVLPGLGVLRDGQKWVALAVPGYAVAAAGVVVALRGRVPVAAVGAVSCALLVAVLPDLAYGVGNRMVAVRYPAGWSAAADIVNADPRPVAVLPPDSMRQFDWAGSAPVLDPLPRWVRADVLSTGDLNVAGTTVPGEGGRARAVQELVMDGASARQLADAGVGWVVVEADGSALDLPVAYRDDDLAVYRVGGDATSSPHRTLLIAVHVAWLALLAGSGLAGCVTLWRTSGAKIAVPLRRRLRRGPDQT